MAKKISPNPNNGNNTTSIQDVIQSGNKATTNQQNSKRTRLSQTDVPSYSLDDALRIPRAIGDKYAFHPIQPLNVAAALGIQPTSSVFRMLTGAAIAYGLTEGGSNAPFISVSKLARRILEPQEDGDDMLARRQAFLRPRVLREFLTKYDRHKLPRDEIAKNVLLTMGVPKMP